MSETALSFERDIKPLFREKDRTSMSKAFDLWSATDVAVHGAAIAARLGEGSMPCDETLVTTSPVTASSTGRPSSVGVIHAPLT